MPSFKNNVDSDQLASDEKYGSRSAVKSMDPDQLASDEAS